MANTIEKKCLQCRETYVCRAIVAKDRKTCSRNCQYAYRKRTRTNKTCLTCGKQFSLRQSDIKYNASKYCSRECTKPMYSQLHRNNKYNLGKSGWCRGIFGDKHPAWKGGKPNERRSRASATTSEYRAWRSSVFKRDNYTCQMCEQYGGTLHADHIKRWADSEDLRYTVDNGRTLCVPCHYYITFKRKMKPGTRWCNFTARKTG